MERKYAFRPIIILSLFALLLSSAVVAAVTAQAPQQPAIAPAPQPLALPDAHDTVWPEGVAPEGAGSLSLFLPALMAPSSDLECAPNTQEQQIADMMRNHPQQKRPSLTCDPILAQVARARAEDMRDRDYFSHTNPDGYGPNYLVRQAGYPLPDFYGDDAAANNIESIAGGYPTAADAFQGWMDSPGHRAHILGEHDFYAAQIDYGIGYAAGGSYGHYWVVITARRG
jgi:uncharacterized protein YkwD